MAIDGLGAAKAYLDTARATAGAGRGGDADVAQGLGGFGDLVRAQLSDAVQTGQRAEGVMTQAAVGRADLVDVVTAVAAAETTLQTVVAIRDQVISAYQDIIRMPI